MTEPNVITRGDLSSSLMPDDVSNEIIQTMPESSVIMTRSKRVLMSAKKGKQPVLASLPDAYWVTRVGSSRPPRLGGRM